MLTFETGVKLLKCVEGQFNKAFLLTMSDGCEIIARLPNPNAGPSFFTVASEVATRHFVRKCLYFFMGELIKNKSCAIN